MYKFLPSPLSPLRRLLLRVAHQNAGAPFLAVFSPQVVGGVRPRPLHHDDVALDRVLLSELFDRDVIPTFHSVGSPRDGARQSSLCPLSDVPPTGTAGRIGTVRQSSPDDIVGS